METDPQFYTLAMPAANYWHQLQIVVPYRKFGLGSVRPFSWYFEGESSVKLKKYSEVFKWLTKCKYKKDAALFGRPDVWQHPLDFEKLQKGDCDDHALWAWRKLIELDIEARFVCGSWKERDKLIPHAWVIFKKPEKKSWHIIECTAKNSKQMFLTEKEAENKYFPELSVDKDYKTYRFAIAKNKRY